MRATFKATATFRYFSTFCSILNEFDLTKDSYLLLICACIISLTGSVCDCVVVYVNVWVCSRQCSNLYWRIHMEISCWCALRLWWASFFVANRNSNSIFLALPASVANHPHRLGAKGKRRRRSKITRSWNGRN